MLWAGTAVVLDGTGPGAFLATCAAVGEILCECHGSRRAVLHLSLYGPLIAAQRFAPLRAGKIAGFDIQKQLDLPRAEAVTLDFAAQHLPEQLVEPVEYDLAVLIDFEHVYTTLIGQPP